MAEQERPEGLTDDHLAHLDELRESGITNMFGAAPYLAMTFRIDETTACAYLSYWMRTFSERRAQS